MKDADQTVPKRKTQTRRGRQEQPNRHPKGAAASAPAIGPTEVEMARAMLPAGKRALACLSLAISIAEQGDEGPLLGSFELNWRVFEQQYLDAINAYRALLAAFPTAGNA